MENKSVLIVALILSATIFSCKKEKADGCGDVAVTKTNIQGKWKHDYPNYEPDLSHPDEYNQIRFVNDSFFLAVTHRSDMLDTGGCHMILWTEYAKGTFVVSNNTKLLLTGIYTEADYTEKISGCYNIGTYKSIFSIKFCNNYLVLYDLDPYLSDAVDRNINMKKE